ncbi:MAG: FtsW/RodA/SpoVE family cell cycle protein [Rikenellaceae bacterium]
MSEIKDKVAKIIGGDRVLWMLIVILSLASIIIIYSSTASLAYSSNDGKTTDYLIKQILFVFGGLVVTYLVHLIDYRKYYENAVVIYGFSMILMMLTFCIGIELNGEKRWLGITGLFTFMPSDFVKIGLTTYLAYNLSKRQKFIDKMRLLPIFHDFKRNKIRNQRIFYSNTLPILGPIAFSAVLVMLTNLSTAIIICLSSLIILIIGRVRWSEIFKLTYITFGLMLGLILILYVSGFDRATTWVNRVESFFLPEEIPENVYELGVTDYQKFQAKVAVASGWLTGKGPGNSTQRSSLPHPYSDYAYAFIIEEYGIAGAIIFLACYLGIFYRTIKIFGRCKKTFPALMVLGLGSAITLQAMLHMGVSVGALPVTGQTLPIISRGGSSLFFTSAMFGIILSISREFNRQIATEESENSRKLVEQEWGQIVVEENTELAEKEENSEEMQLIRLMEKKNE